MGSPSPPSRRASKDLEATGYPREDTITSTSSSRSSSYSDQDDPDRIHELQEVPSEAPGMPATIESSTDIPPDGGYGWVCVACGTIVNACTWGVNSVCSPVPETGGNSS